MPPLDAESQFKFLISCIKHSTAGKVDFSAVSNELGIVSKAAAAKRYERLMKAHGVTPNTSSATTTPKKTTPKKRKTAPAGEDGMDDDEDVKPNIEEDEKLEKKQTKKESRTKAKKEKLEVSDDGSSRFLHTIPEAPHVSGHDGDGDTCLLCTAEQTNNHVSDRDDGGAPQTANMLAGMQPFDSLANLSFHPQAMLASDHPAPAFTNNSTAPLPLPHPAITPSAWFTPHPEPHHFYWDMFPQETSHSGHQT